MIDDGRSCDSGVDAGMEFSPDDITRMELALSDTTEDFSHDECAVLDSLLAYGVPVDGSLVSHESEKPEGPQEPEYGCCDMTLDEYDPQNAISGEMDEMVLAEPDSPEEE